MEEEPPIFKSTFPKKEETKETISEAEKVKNQGNDEYKKGNFGKAIELYEQAFKLDPTEYLYLNNKAAALLEEGKSEECLKVCDEALEVAKG